jgi:hypothetical protein
MVNTSQQVGGSIGTALLNTLAANAATDYVASHLPATPAVAAEAAVPSYVTAYSWGAGLFIFGAILSALLFRRRGAAVPRTDLTSTDQPRADRPSTGQPPAGPNGDLSSEEPVLTH